jgi:hypothetical protein
MQNLFGILTLVSIVALMVGLVSPKLVLPWTEMKSRKKVVITYLLTFLFSCIMIGVTAEAPTDRSGANDGNGEKISDHSQVVDSTEIKKSIEEERIRLAEENAKREAEAVEAAEIQKRADEEIDSDGLVLLKKTIRATRGEYGGEITGMVINRRSEKLGYVQITFSLYDNSGAQVGSAMANINNLDSGGKWKFSASTFGTDYAKYKFAELSGF